MTAASSPSCRPFVEALAGESQFVNDTPDVDGAEDALRLALDQLGDTSQHLHVALAVCVQILDVPLVPFRRYAQVSTFECLAHDYELVVTCTCAFPITARAVVGTAIGDPYARSHKASHRQVIGGRLDTLARRPHPQKQRLPSGWAT
jgi:hypothetical protein